MAKPTVLVRAELTDGATERLRTFADVRHEPGISKETLLQERPAVQGIIASGSGAVWYDAQLMDALPGLRIISRTGVGYEVVDVRAATERGIAVATAPGTNAVSVAEMTFFLMLGVARNYPLAGRIARSGTNWREPKVWMSMRGRELYGKTLGVIGVGNIGSRVALRARAFGMPVIGYDPYVDKPRAARAGVTLTRLENVLRKADVLSIHCPQTEETTHLIDADRLSLMKPTAILINTARGGIIDEPALIDALRNGVISGAGLDVYDPEPPLPGNPLFDMENVVLMPHQAGVTDEAWTAICDAAVQNVRAIFKGGKPFHVVNAEVLKKPFAVSRQPSAPERKRKG